MIFITDELGNIEKNILELVENVGLKDCKTIEAIDLFCGISERNDVLKEKDRYYAFIDMYANMKPKFVKQFAQVGKEMNEAFTAYKKAVEEGSFPGEEHTFKMDETIIDKLY